MDTTFIPSELNTPHQIVNAYDKLSNLKASDKPDMEKLDKEFDTDEYESLPKNITSTSIHLTAGAVAGVMEHCIVYPIDSVKTRMQSLAPNPQARYRSVIDGLQKMVVKEGFRRPFKGMGVMVVGAGPAHALYFSSYEKLKRVLSGTETGGKNPIAQMAAGTVSTMLHDAIMNPADVIKQRIQMYNSPHKNAVSCAITVLRQEGLQAFYRSYPTQLAMNIPFHCTHLAIYEFTQEQINPKRTYSPVAHTISGGLAGALAAAITTPLDVCKTLLNTQEANVLKSSKTSQIKGFFSAISIIYNCCGIRGYFNGLNARMMFSAPSTAISWTVYESFKFYLGNKKMQSSAVATNQIAANQISSG